MSLPKKFDPEVIEDARYRYEETDEPVASIAQRLGMHERTFRDYAHVWNFKLRKDRPPRGLSEPDRLHAEALAMPTPPPESATADEGRPPADASAPAAAATPQAAADAAETGAAPGEAASEAQRRAELISRLIRNIEQELDGVEQIRAHRGDRPPTPSDAQKTAHTLASLTRNLNEVERLGGLRGIGPARTGPHDDDIPTDIDEFRHALADRIEAFIRSRTDL